MFRFLSGTKVLTLIENPLKTNQNFIRNKSNPRSRNGVSGYKNIRLWIFEKCFDFIIYRF